MSVVSQVTTSGGKTTFKSLNPYSPGIKYASLEELIKYLCMFAQFDGWHDHKNFKNIVELVNAYTPGGCKAICDAQPVRPRVYVSEDAFLQTMLRDEQYVGFHRPKFTDAVYRTNDVSFFVSSSGAYIQKTQGQLPSSIFAPAPAPDLPPPSKMTACCYVLNDADVAEIYSESVAEKYHVAHIIVDAAAGDDSDREGFDNFSLLQYCFAGLFGITDDIYILRDVAKSNFGVSCSLFGTDWSAYMQGVVSPPMPLNQRVIALNTGAVFYDPGPTLNPTTGAGKAHGFSTVGSKSLCGVCIGTEVVQYPKFIELDQELTSEDPIGILMYSKYDMELSTEGFSGPDVGVTNAQLTTRFANVKSTLNIHDDTDPTKKLVYSVTRDNSNKETDSNNVPILDVISNAFRNGRNIIITSGPKKVASKKVGDSGIQLYTSQLSIEHMLIEPEGDGSANGIAKTYRLTPSISNGIHASVTYDLGAFKIGLKYGNPISILNMPNGFLLCVSKELVARYSNPAQKMDNAKNRLESLRRIFEETKAKRISVGASIDAKKERYEDIKGLLDVMLKELGEIPTINYNDKTYQHVLSMWYLFTPILRLIKSIDKIPEDKSDVDEAVAAASEETMVDAYWTPSQEVLDDLTSLTTFITVKESDLSTYKSLLSNKFSLHEMYKNVDELFQGIITRFNIKKPAFSVDGIQFLPYYLGTYEDNAMVEVTKEQRKQRFGDAFSTFARNAEDIIGIVTKPANSPKIRDAVPYKSTSGKLSLRAFTMCMDHADLDYFNNETISHIVSNLGQDALGSFKVIMNYYFEDVKARASIPKKSNVRDCLREMRVKIPEIIDGGSQLLTGGMRGGAYLNPADEAILETIRAYIYVFLLIKSELLMQMIESEELIQKYINRVINEAYSYLELPIPSSIDARYIESLGKWKGDFVSQPMESEYDDGRMFTYIPKGVNTEETLQYAKFVGDKTFKFISEQIGYFNKYISKNKANIDALKIKRLSYYCDNYDTQLIEAEINSYDSAHAGKDVDILLAIDEIQLVTPALVRGDSDGSAASPPPPPPFGIQQANIGLGRKVTVQPLVSTSQLPTPPPPIQSMGSYSSSPESTDMYTDSQDTTLDSEPSPSSQSDDMEPDSQDTTLGSQPMPLDEPNEEAKLVRARSDENNNKRRLVKKEGGKATRKKSKPKPNKKIKTRNKKPKTRKTKPKGKPRNKTKKRFNVMKN